MPDFTKMFRTEITEQPSYNAGIAKGRFFDEYGIDCIAKLDSNENPHGPSPYAIEALHGVVADISSYPDSDTLALCQAIGKGFGIPADRVVTSNGSEDMILMIYRAILNPGDNIVTICPSFGPHEFAAVACSATATKIQFGDDWSFPTSSIVAALSDKPRVLMFSSPSNPAGVSISERGFDEILEALSPETLFVFDEAYAEFVDPNVGFDALGKLEKSGLPWISLRTFSKAYGLAGARIGYALCSDRSISDTLQKIRPPFGVNALAAAAATAAFNDKEHLNKCVNNIALERAQVYEALKSKGYTVVPSHANFLFFDCREEGANFAKKLRNKGILIKGWKEEPYLNWARVSIGLPEHNDAFIAALDHI